MKFKCEICGKKFKKANGLKLHLERSKDEAHTKARQEKLEAEQQEVEETIVETVEEVEIPEEVTEEQVEVVEETPAEEPQEEQPEEVLEESVIDESPVIDEVVETVEQEEPQAQSEIVQEYVPNITDDGLVKEGITTNEEILDQQPSEQQIEESKQVCESPKKDRKPSQKTESKLDPYNRLNALGVIAPNLSAIRRKNPIRALNV